MVSALVPLGFAAISRLPSIVAENARSTAPWNLQARFDPSGLVPWIEQIAGEDGAVSQTFHSGSDLRFLSELGQRLASGVIEAYAIAADTGELVRTTPADWRRPIMKDTELVAPVFAVRDGALLPLVRPNVPTSMALPIVALHDVAVAFGATAPPAPPDPKLLDGLVTECVPGTQVDFGKAARAKIWMHGFAQGFFEGKGEKAKQEHALLACRNATGCTDRAARDAWKAVPADLKRPPRSLTTAEGNDE